MKRVLLVSFGLIAMATYAGCLPPEDGTPTGTAGKGGSDATAGTGGSNATAGTGGSNATAGTGGSDNTAGTGGSDATAGTGGSVSTAGTGGGATAGTGGGTAGTGGRGGTGGGTAGTGGGTAGTGGRGGTGGGTAGTGGGTAGTGGRGGTGGGTAGTGGGTAGTGGTGGGGLPDVPTLFPTSGTLGSLDGRLVVMPCGDANTGGTDCGGGGAYYSTAGATTATNIACSGGNLNVNQVFYVGGETGRMYNVTVHFYGVSEPKNYGTTNLTREATNRPAATPTGAGATPTPWASAPGNHTYPVSDYNTAEVRVCRTRACAAADETAVYYLNADTSEGHWSYVINYEKPITVVGGGAVRVRNYDRNCRQIKNCGPSGTQATACATAANARIITTTAAMPAPRTGPAASGGLSQPNFEVFTAGSSGQWLLIDVVRVNSVQ